MGRKAIDLTGMQFGRLTVIERADIRHKEACWLCRCNCENGTLVTIRSSSLVRGYSKSCGCLRKESLSKTASSQSGKLASLAHRLSNNTPGSRNTSGVVGVSWVSTRKRWIATISFNAKRVYLGSFTDFGEAVAVRKEAESHIYGPFLDWYKENIRPLPARKKVS